MQGLFDGVQAGGQLDRLVGVAAGEIQLLLVILHLHLDELEAVGGRDHHHALCLVNLAGLEQLEHGRQRHAGVRAVEHAGAVAERRGVGQLLLAGLLDDAVELLQDADGLLEADRVADLDGAGQRLLRLHRLEDLEVAQVSER